MVYRLLEQRIRRKKKSEKKIRERWMRFNWEFSKKNCRNLRERDVHLNQIEAERQTRLCERTKGIYGNLGA